MTPLISAHIFPFKISHMHLVKTQWVKRLTEVLRCRVVVDARTHITGYLRNAVKRQGWNAGLDFFYTV